MTDFESYVDHLESLANQLSLAPQDAGLRNAAAAELGAEPGSHVRAALPIKDQRELGAFFTPPELANYVLSRRWFPEWKLSTVMDPSCGAGDLLLAALRQLPSPGPRRRGDCRANIGGVDGQSEFVRAARARLAMAEILRTNSSLGPEPTSAFASVVAGDFFSHSFTSLRRTWLLNPPYGYVSIPDDMAWAKGQVSAAAVFLDRVLDTARSGDTLVAILPDSLRSGSRYQRWRNSVELRARKFVVETHTRFDKFADIHVFILALVVGTGTASGRCSPWRIPHSTGLIISNQFSVHTGPLVDYREPHRGPWRRYLRVCEAKRWGEVDADLELRNRRFRGTVFNPPFVVVRRTSRPEDSSRVVPTIVCGTVPVAVENHLLVLKPLDGSYETCKEACSVFADVRTSSWLDERIRCRHLTVSSVREIPWWPKQAA